MDDRSSTGSTSSPNSKRSRRSLPSPSSIPPSRCPRSLRGPLLFLLDEMLAGTNSHDRRIGADAIVRALVERGAVGLVSTHDLALAQIADELAPKAANVHFEDHLEHGNVVFDYRMRPGVVTKSNALALMRSVGIDV